MGCDVHMTVERKTPSGWVCIDTMLGHVGWADGQYCLPIARARNYKRFAALAGVRGDGPEPRGVPEDVSETTKYLIDEWAGDGHSHSWLPLKEAAAIMLDTEYQDKSEYSQKYPAEFFFNVWGNALEDYRVVFWFDN